MKNYYSITLVALFLLNVSIISRAQTKSEFGVKGGALYTGIKFSNESSFYDFKNSSGLSIGAFYRKDNLIGPIGLKMELLYQMKGANIYIQHPDLVTSEFGENNPGYGYFRKGSYLRALSPVLWDRHQERYHYFSLPVLITFQPAKFLDVYSGFELGYMFANSVVYSSDFNLTILGDLNKFSASWVAGAAVRLGDKTRLDFRYSGNLVPLYEMRSSDIKDHSFSISIEQSLWRK